MARLRKIAASTPFVGAAALLLATPAAASAATELHKVPWSTAYGTATAAGQHWVDSTGSTSAPFGTVHVEGDLKNTGSDCYSLWVRWNTDLVVGPPRKHVSQCGSGAAKVRISAAYMPTTVAYVAICRGTKDTKDCNEWKKAY